MKKSTIVTIILIAAAVVLGVIFISWYLRKATPLYIQGTVECTTYKASSKVPGRIEEMKVEEGQHVTKGELLYTLSTPELNAKLQQAEAVKSAASAMDQKALTGARIQQKEAALNLWEKAQAGLLLAQKTFDRVNNLYEQGVVPAQKLDEARANLQAMQATERAAKAQWNWYSTEPARRRKRRQPPRYGRPKAPFRKWSPIFRMPWFTPL